MELRQAGSVAVVTGAASGIGRATAERLAGEGAAVALLDRSGPAVELVAQELIKQGLTANAWQCDVTDEIEVSRVVGEVTESLGPIAVLCTAAGILESGEIIEQSLDMWDRTLDVNLRGQLIVLRAVLPGMYERKAGSVVMMSSVSALVGDRSVSAYAVSKAGVSSLAKQVAAEGAAFGVRCNAVCPGWVNTPFNDVVFTSPDERDEVVRRTVPLGREGTPAEVAALVAFLASNEAAYITGTSVLIDGGLLLGVHN